MIQKDGLTLYEFIHNQRQKIIMEWLRYNIDLNGVEEIER